MFKRGTIKQKSKLTSFTPILDEFGIIRVGGRIHRAQIDENQKHPMIIPHNSHLAKLLVADAHNQTLHGGPRLMLTFLQAKYWIIGAKSLVKQYFRKCVKCIRYTPSNKPQLMGQLPTPRVTPNRAFLFSGVDFAGPINIRASKGRGHSSYKGYICLFICLSTKAVHLEAVSDLSSQGFLAAFRRFGARRGHCSDLYSDNGTNFVGAARELKKLFHEERSHILPEILDWLSTNSTQWHFIPPHAPNFGGLWEAAIKSTKHHLRRVIGNSTLTFEEMTTLLAQIEACLNSRPLSYIVDQAENSPLTPGHFLVGEPLVLPPDHNYEQTAISSLRRWQLCQRMLKDFWRRWSDEYLVGLMRRQKWKNATPEPQVGNVVLIRESDLPPGRWLMGVVTEKHPGADNITRVVTIRCKDSSLKRPTSKLCILPVAE